MAMMKGGGRGPPAHGEENDEAIDAMGTGLNCSSVCSFARTAHSFARSADSALLASLELLTHFLGPHCLFRSHAPPHSVSELVG